MARNKNKEDKMYKKGYGESFVKGHDPQVGRDSHAGMPNDVVMKDYPKSKMRKGNYLDDSMSEIDAIQMDSEHQVEAHLSNQK